jgi:4-hydroxythreonine-4-phosphate dehydrogenase
LEPVGVFAVTMGDPAGIGPEVCLKAIRRWRGETDGQTGGGKFAPIVFGDAGVLQRLAEASGLEVPPVSESLDEAIEFAAAEGAAVLHIESLFQNRRGEGDSPIFPRRPSAVNDARGKIGTVLDGSGDDFRPGVVSARTGRASYDYIVKAIEAALAGRVGAIVTGPIHKEALRDAGIPYPGHTEIFEALTKSPRACMMLTSEALTCSFVTTHVGLCDVPGLLSTGRVLDVLELTAEGMQKILGRPPRLVVCGLNPHAGEGGLFGRREEELIIAPAIEEARRQGIDVEGPLPPDTAFLAARRKRTDAFVCMYHDQGHIPLKALSFETAVNTTLGLPVVRTSVDHGTALDIAWQKFNADETSMVQAMRLARKLAAGREDETSNRKKRPGTIPPSGK